MKRKNKLFTAAFRVFLSSLMGVLILSLGMVTSVQAIEPADLTIEMTDSGNFVQGGTGRTYTITVRNIGDTPTSGQITVDNYLFENGVLTAEGGAPIILTATGIVPPASDGWICNLNSPTITCISDTVVLEKNETAVFTLTVNVAVDAPVSVTNEADVSGGGDVIDIDEINSVSHPTTITQKPDLTIAKSESGDFEQRGVGIYTITVTNSNTVAATDGTTAINVEIILPVGLTLKTLTGTNWTCNTTELSCSRDASYLDLIAGASFDDIILTVDVKVNAASSVKTEVEVSGGGEVNTTNNSDVDETTIVQKPDLAITSVTLVPEYPATAEEFVLHVEGANLGGASSGSVITVYAFVDPDPWPPPLGWADDEYLVYSSDITNDDPIEPYKTFTKDITITGGLSSTVDFPDVIPPHTIYVYVDAKNLLENTESYRENNISGPIVRDVQPDYEVAINGNVGLPNVTLSYKVGEITLTETSTANGDYEFFVPNNWSGTVTPTLAGYGFSPASIEYTNVTAIQADQNYTANGSLSVTSVGAKDGWVLESSESSTIGGSFNATQPTFILGDNAQKKQYRSILSFNTAALPENARITSVTLKVRKGGIAGGFNPVNPFGGFMADVRKGFFGTSPLTIGDFQAKATKTVGPSKPAPVGGWYSLNLINAKGSLNTLGTTQIRLRFQSDDNNNAIANLIKFYSGNTPTVAYRPKLVINYSIP